LPLATGFRIILTLTVNGFEVPMSKKKPDKKRVEQTSADLAQESIAQLRELFPQAVTVRAPLSWQLPGRDPLGAFEELREVCRRERLDRRHRVDQLPRRRLRQRGAGRSRRSVGGTAAGPGPGPPPVCS
jgi:hypothetical protein